MFASGYLKRKPTADAQARLRRLVRRLKLPARDVAAWLSILRQIVWKLQQAWKKRAALGIPWLRPTLPGRQRLAGDRQSGRSISTRRETPHPYG